jgi:hypothetical protein
VIRKSTTITGNYTVPADGKVVSLNIPLKSTFSGDTCDIKSLQFRAFAQGGATANNILSSGGAHDIGTSTITIVPKKRPQLMHQHGVLVETSTTGIAFCKPLIAGQDQVDVGSVSFMVKPVSGTVRIARGAITVDISSAGLLTVTGAATVYANGAVWATATSRAFPYSRLVTIAYTAKAASPVTVGMSTGTGSFYLHQFSATQRLLDATDAATHARLFYRKPSVETVLTDTGVTSVPNDNAVTLPADWIEL